MRYAAFGVVLTIVICLPIVAAVWLITESWRPAGLTVFLAAFPAMFAADWILQRLGVRDDWKPPSQDA